MKLRPNFDRVLTIEEPVITQNAGGQMVKNWIVLKSVRANRMDLTVNETLNAEQELGRLYTHWLIRFTDGLKPDQRVSDGFQLYKIVGVQEVERRKFLKISTIHYDNE